MLPFANLKFGSLSTQCDLTIIITHHAVLWPRTEKGVCYLAFATQTTMYIAGLHLSMPSPQGVEGLAALTTADFFRYLLWKLRAPKVTTGTEGEPEGGLPVPEFAPRSLLDKLVLPIQSLAVLLPPAVYCTAVLFNNFQQPAWMLKLALPEDIVPPEWKAPVRLVACVAGFSLKFALDRILSHSDERWRMIGVSLLFTPSDAD